MNWNNVSLVVLGLSAFGSAFVVALWISLVIWTFRDMRTRSRDAFAQLLAALMMLVLGPLGIVLYLLLRPSETLAEKYERSLEEEALLQDIEERQICPGCKQPIEPDFMLCPICHTGLRQPCVHCGRLIHPRWGLCPYCASSQKPIPGVEKAGRVTLLDLEEEAVLQPEQGQVMDEEKQLQVERELDLDQIATDDFDEEAFAESFDAQWELAEEEQSEPDPLADLFSAEDASAGDAADAESTTAQADESAGTDTTTGGTPRRPLSLFKRP